MIPDPASRQLKRAQAEFDTLLGKFNEVRKTALVRAAPPEEIDEPGAPGVRPEVEAPFDQAAEDKRAKALAGLKESIAAMRAEAVALKISEDARDAHILKLDIQNRLLDANIEKTSEVGKAYLKEAEEARAAIEAAEKRNEQLDHLRETIERAKTEQQLFNETIAEWTALAAEGTIGTEELAAATAQLKVELDGAKTKTNEVKTATQEAALTAEDLGNKLLSAFEGAIQSGGDFKSILKGLIQDLSRMGLEMFKLSFKDGGLTGGGGGGGFGGIIKQLGGFISGFGGGGGGGGGIASITPFASAPGAGTPFKRGGRVGVRPGSGRVSPVFAGASRFAGGGIIGSLTPKLQRDEVPIIAHVGERVLTQAQSRAMEKSTARPISVVMQISTPDADSFRENQDQIVGRLSNALRHAERNA